MGGVFERILFSAGEVRDWLEKRLPWMPHVGFDGLRLSSRPFAPDGFDITRRGALRGGFDLFRLRLGRAPFLEWQRYDFAPAPDGIGPDGTPFHFGWHARSFAATDDRAMMRDWLDRAIVAMDEPGDRMVLDGPDYDVRVRVNGRVRVGRFPDRCGPTVDDLMHRLMYGVPAPPPAREAPGLTLVHGGRRGRSD